eukprot:CAMPEP_0172368968 /NCGR_PEP_ID=MMETSP1060-20121228/29912_1 /TAXON_ID=37318 /ORGANISM="Pseudo-nitzschia pungens, Strain cf. cingulata" /LENGTH=353 /DNA_ID=CAMNT_0013093721 /DNA_START=163 /DNA_END=1221 /DNA_ORIENTATION=+
MDHHDNDDNEKESKIHRQSRGFLKKAGMTMAVLTIFALVLGHVHTKERPQLARDIDELLLKHESQLQEPLQKAAAAAAAADAAHDKDEDGEDIYARMAEPLEVLKKAMETAIEAETAVKVAELDQKVRDRKLTRGVIMETDPEGLELTKALQAETLELLKHRYGFHITTSVYRVRVDLVYPDSIVAEGEDDHARLIIELAPPELIPCSVFYFLELARTYIGGSFHRNAGHVLQAAAQSEATKGHRSMPFQEYSPDFPHKKYTTGYAGRPSGPGWYVSIQDNTKNHGPGSQQEHNPYEADSNFGRVVEGVENGVVAKIHSIPQKGWLDKENSVKITGMTILVPQLDNPEEWIEW